MFSLKIFTFLLIPAKMNGSSPVPFIAELFSVIQQAGGSGPRERHSHGRHRNRFPRRQGASAIMKKIRRRDYRQLRRIAAAARRMSPAHTLN